MVTRLRTSSLRSVAGGDLPVTGGLMRRTDTTHLRGRERRRFCVGFLPSNSTRAQPTISVRFGLPGPATIGDGMESRRLYSRNHYRYEPWAHTR